MRGFNYLSGYSSLVAVILALTLLSISNLLVAYYASGIVLVLFVLASITLGLAGFYLIRKNVIAPLKSLNEVSENLASGNLQVNLSQSVKGEIGAVVQNMNKLVSNLESASVFAGNIGSGNFASEYAPAGDGDKLGLALIHMRAKLQDIYAKDEKRNWVTEGLAKFGELLASDSTNLTTMFNKIISALVKYLNANQGGIFIINSDDANHPYMQLVGTYAWDRKKFLEKRIAPGEGLIGQAWLEKEITYLKEVPGDFITITSGLGEATPRNIVIIPLIANDDVFGIIEIASFKSIEEYQLTFLSKLGENIAATISRVKVSEQTKKLLIESQEQSEGLRSQEEEMRQNMEELQATQEQLQRREKEQVQEITRLNELHEQTAASFKRLSLVADNTDNSVVITDETARIEYVNHGFTKLTGYTLEEVVGKKPGSFLQGEGTNQQTVSKIRKHLLEQIPFYEEILNYDKYGKEYWISLAINPVFENGKLKNFISIQANVTQTKIKSLDFTYQLNAIGLSNAVIEFDITGHVQHANEKFLKTMGYSLEEIKGKNHQQFVFDEDINGEVYRTMWSNLGKGKSSVGEFRRKTKDGSVVWLKGTYTAILDLKGNPYKIIKFAQDITEQKAKALDFEGQVDAVNNTMASIEFDMEGVIVYANEKFLSTMGYTLDEIIHQHHRMFVATEYANSAPYKKFWNDLAKGHSQSGEFQRIGKNKKDIWLSASYTPIKDANGKVYKVIKFAQNITEQKLKSIDYSCRMSAIDNTMASIEFNMDGSIVDANPKFLSAMDYQLEEVKSKHHRIFLTADYAESEAYVKFWEKLNEGIAQTGEFKRVGKNGKEVWINASYTPIKDFNGSIYKVIKFAQIVSEQKLKTLDFEGQINAVNNTMAAVEFNVDGIVIWANQKFLETMGYSLDEIIGKHHRLFVDSNHSNQEDYKKFWNELAIGKSQSGEFQRVGKGGKDVWLSASYTPIKNTDDKIYKIIKFALDITTQKLKTLDYEGQIEAIKRSNAVIEFDIQGNIIYANEIFIQAMGYQKDNQVIYKHHKIFVYEEDQVSEEYRNFWNRLSRGEYFVGEFRRKRFDGSEVWIRGSYNPILNTRGEPYKVVKYAQVLNGQR